MGKRYETTIRTIYGGDITRKEINFPANVKVLRKQLGYTQEQLANKIFVAQNLISKYETGNAYPLFDGLCLLAEVLEVSLDTLVYERLEGVRMPTALSGLSPR